MSKEQITWLGFTATQYVETPTKQTCKALVNLETPQTLKLILSSMGCIHQLIKFLPNLASISIHFRKNPAACLEEIFGNLW